MAGLGGEARHLTEPSVEPLMGFQTALFFAWKLLT